MYKPVEEYSSFGGKITKLYYCVAAAARELGIDYYTMMKLVKTGQRYNYKYYRWYYKEKVKSNTTIKYNIIQKRDNKIINQFKSVNEASLTIGLGRNIIKKLIDSGEVDQWGCIWIDRRKEKERNFRKV